MNNIYAQLLAELDTMPCGCGTEYRCTHCGKCYPHQHQFKESDGAWLVTCPVLPLNWRAAHQDGGNRLTHR